MKKFSFRQYQATKKDGQLSKVGSEDTSSRRREQLRKAQKTHRERKEAYIRFLENEVLQLRANETNLFQKAQALNAELGRLRKMLAEYGVDMDPTTQSSLLQSNVEPVPSVAVSIRANIFGGKQLHVEDANSNVQYHDFSFSPSQSSVVSSPNSGILDLLRWDKQQISRQETHLQPIYQPFSTSGSTNLSICDLTITGIEFVLTLESPCMAHVQGNPHDHFNSTGHSITVSSQLLSQAPTPVEELTPSTTWEQSKVGLERLLEISAHLDLQGEVTPVQAWDYIKAHPYFCYGEIDCLRKLTAWLLKEAKCHGFGVVIDKTILEEKTFEAFVVGKVF
ncbi:hypothetical protein M501DRAFT_1001219 [Patellaria atrata CBS 101060]|uniref:BZIP domain-containing protein n=1 Tax=Patellaria atrata CBS 101060 TaxID=1346257 RepID=A0A9P4VNC0_9PEZI|nr:hypothetical protein M501DRAFT_1001219 [Patellaria atrata CBS 101060]